MGQCLSGDNMIFKLGNITLDIDVEKTAEFHAGLQTVAESCGCAGCRNYDMACGSFPVAVREFFSMLGMDIEKATEIITWYVEDEEGKMYYGGFYHLCGKIIKGDECWKDNGELNLHEICEGYSAGFTTEISLPEENLPYPALQMEVFFHGVPWMLDEENPY